MKLLVADDLESVEQHLPPLRLPIVVLLVSVPTCRKIAASFGMTWESDFATVD